MARSNYNGPHGPAAKILNKNPDSTGQRFRYASFSERLDEKNLSLAAIELRSKRNAIDAPGLEDRETYFSKGLAYWAQYNLTTPFAAFVNQVRDSCQTLAQIYHHQNEIVDAILASLKNTDNSEAAKLAGEPIFDLVVRLSQDLGDDFLPHYEKLVVAILTSANEADDQADLVEHSFTALVLLFKHLRSSLVKDLESTLIILRPFLGLAEQSEAVRLENVKPRKIRVYVKRFTAESFAYLLRKAGSKQLEDILQHFLRDIVTDSTESASFAVANVLFETMRGVEKRYHSKAELVLSTAMKVMARLLNRSMTTISATNGQKVMMRLCTALTHHGNAITMSSLVELSCEHARKAVAHKDHGLLLSTLAALVAFTGTRKASRIAKRDEIYQLLSLIDMHSSDTVSQLCLLLSYAILTTSSSEEGLTHGRYLLERILNSSSNGHGLGLVFALCRTKWPHIERLLIPALLTKASHQPFSDEEGQQMLIILNECLPHGALEQQIFRYSTAEDTARLRNNLRNYVCQLAETRDMISFNSCAMSLLVLRILLLEKEPVDESFVQTLLKNSRHLEDDLAPSYVGFVLQLASRAPTASWTQAVFTEAIRLLEQPRYVRSHLFVTGIHCLWARHPLALQELSNAALDEAHQALTHPDRRLRVALLQILKLHYRMKASTNSMIDECLALEAVPVHLDRLRDKSQVLRRLVLRVNNMTDSAATHIVLRLHLSLFAANLQPLWSEAGKMLPLYNEDHQKQIAKIALETVLRYNEADNVELSRQYRDLTSPARPSSSVDKTFECASLDAIQASMEQALAVMTEHISETVGLYATRNWGMESENMDRIDIASYYEHLLSGLHAIVKEVEGHHRIFAPLLISFYHRHYRHDALATDTMRFGAKQSHAILQALMNLNKLFKSSQSMFRNLEVRSIYSELLTMGDMSAQALSLDCILTWREDTLLRHGERLRNLLNENTFNAELSNIASLLSSVDSSSSSQCAVLRETVMRILYGRLVSRKAKGSNSRGMQARRVAIFNALGGCDPDSINRLVRLMSQHVECSHQKEETYALRQQIGFLTLTRELMERLALRAQSSWSLLLAQIVRSAQYAESKCRDDLQDSSTVQHNTIFAESNATDCTRGVGEYPDSDEDVADLEQDDSSFMDTNKDQELLRKPRRLAKAVHRLALSDFTHFFRHGVESEYFLEIVSPAYEAMISPRISRLHLDAAQGPSATLRLLEAWALDPKYHQFFAIDTRIIQAVSQVITVRNVKASSVDLAIDILSRLILGKRIQISTHFPHMIASVAGFLTTSEQAADVSENMIAVCQFLVVLAPYCPTSDHGVVLMTTLISALSKMAGGVERLRIAIMKAIIALVNTAKAEQPFSAQIRKMLFDALVKMLVSMKSSEGRDCILTLLQMIAQHERDLLDASATIVKLNAVMPDRGNQPDFDQRLEAFASITSRGGVANFNARSATALLSQLLFSLHDVEEESIRSNASSILREFIKTDSNSPTRLQAVRELLLPSLKKGLRTKSEEVRFEILQLLGCIVTFCTDLALSRELLSLIPDEESNFFSNFAHIQKHRRIRAMDRLVRLAQAQAISSATVTQIFLPLILQHLDQGAIMDPNVFNAGVICLTALCRCLTWATYRRLVSDWFVKAKLKDNTGMQKRNVRVLVATLEGFHFYEGCRTHASDKASGFGERTSSNLQEIVSYVQKQLLPDLALFLRQSQETEALLRVPIAVGMAHLISGSPDQEHDSARSLFTAICQILRSRSQETRDAVRDTLQKLILFFGPKMWLLLIQELKASLNHGSQYHVLSYSLHWLLVKCVDHINPGDLDEAMPVLIQVVTHDIFTDLATEREDKEYLSRLKERKGNKSFDTLEICSRTITPAAMSHILIGLKKVMISAHRPKDLQYLDEALRRVAAGMNSNKSLDAKTMLSISHELMTQNVSFLEPHIQSLSKSARANESQYIVHTKRELAVKEDYYEHNAHRFVTLGLDLLRHAIKHRLFDVTDTTIMSMLNAFPPTLGDYLFSDQESIIASSLRLLQDLLRFPLPALADVLDNITRRVLVIVGDGTILFKDSQQVALRFLATVIRDRPEIEFENWQLEAMLQSLKVGLDQPENRMNCFNILRAILSRKFLAASIYELMDNVAGYVVTDQNSQVREISRNATLQFLLDYPQGRSRIRKIMAFLTSNLTYDYESGRLSVLELLGAILLKFGDSVLDPFYDSLFLALFMALINDESSKCRAAVMLLIRSLISRSSSSQMAKIWELLANWLRSGEEAVAAGALICLGLLQEERASYMTSHLDFVIMNVSHSLSGATDATARTAIVVSAMQLLIKFLNTSDEATKRLLADADLQQNVVRQLSQADAEIRTTALRALGHLFAKRGLERTADSESSRSVFTEVQQTGLAYKHLDMLKQHDLTQDQGAQLVKNVVYIIRLLWTTDSRLAFDTDAGRGASELDGDSDEETQRSETNALRSILTSLSMLSRRTRLVARDYASGELPHTYIVQVFASLSQVLPEDAVKFFLPHMLNALYRISCDETAPPSPALTELKTMTAETMNLLQSRCGTSTYTMVYAKIRKRVQDTRIARKEKRSVLEMTEPEQAAKRKVQRGVMKKNNALRKASRHRQERIGDREGALRVRKAL